MTNVRGLVDAALGRIPLDLLVENVTILNVFTGELIENQSIGSHKDTIVYVGGQTAARFRAADRIDGKGRIAIPGLIDTHLHIESTMLVPSRFAEAVLPRGTTAVFADPHEIVNVLGKSGLKMMVNNSKHLPMKIFYLVPSCVPESSAVTSGARIDSKDVSEMLGWKGVAGLAEVMDYPGLLANDRRISEIVEVARERGVVIDGHAPFLKSAELCAYVASGPEADHENFDPESAIEKLRKGMYVKLRGPDILDPHKFVDVLTTLPKLWNVLFVTDDVMPDRLEEFGHLDRVCRSFIAAGMDPIEVVRGATLRAAEHVRMPHLGAIAPGKIADILILTNLKHFRPDVVISNGVVAARGGKLLLKFQRKKFDRSSLRSIHAPKLTENDFVVRFPFNNGSAKLNCIEFSRIDSSDFSNLVVTTFGEVEARIIDGKIHASDIAIAFVVERHRKSGRTAFAFVHNLMKSGALATTVSHDSHNLTVLGTNPSDMLLAARLVIRSRGGVAAVRDRRVLAKIGLPIAGLMSEERLGTVAREMRRMRAAFHSMGMIDHPYMPVPFLLTLSVIPHARITDRGLFDVDAQKLVKPFEEKKNMRRDIRMP